MRDARPGQLLAIGRPRLVGLAAVAALLIVPSRPSRASSPEPEIGRYRAHVATLASAEFGGRRGPGAIKAAAYVEDEFRRLGLEPLFDGSFRQEIPDATTGKSLGRNVGGVIHGSDPKLAGQFVVIGAHFDHLGKVGRQYYPGADDNASGVAMILEVARCVAQSDTPPRRSVIFLGFDREEDGLWGSRFFVENPPVPLDSIKLFITADMIGRDLAGVCKDFVFAFGSETSPGLRPWIDAASAGEPIRLGLLANDLLLVDRSDYGPFRKREIPYLFFSTGENPVYHRVGDTADTLDYAKAIATTRIIARVVRKAAGADTLAPWNPISEPDLREVLVVRDVLQVLMAHRDDLKIGTAPRLVLKNTLNVLDGIIARGKITAAERARLVQAARFLLYSVISP